MDINIFYQKQTRYQTLLQSNKKLKNDCAKLLSKKQLTTSKKMEILILQDKIQNMKLAISEKKKAVIDKKNHLQKLKLKVNDQKSRVDRYEKRVIGMEEFTLSQEIISTDKSSQLSAMKPNLKNVIQTRISQLVTHIFSLDKVHPVIYQNEELDVTNSLIRALSEASKLTYVGGQWVDISEDWSHQTELGYFIVAPILPANGNYSAYNEWAVLDQTKDYTSNQTFSKPNPACTISAGLMYTSQLVKQLSFFLNVFLPQRQHFSEFSVDKLNPDKFAKYVCRLNSNVLYLCFSQNVDPKFLHPDYTLKNIFLLLDATYSDLGRFDPPDINSSLYNDFERRITLQLLSYTSDSDSEEENDYKWEAVPINELPEQSQCSLDTTNSVVRASLASSIASIWHGWTK